ncbi:aminoacyl-tRNA hydrolase [bacterium 1XD8-76]|nr:aminoacyl-tRNA hydrolase [bacterium 1XD8-76]
MFCIVGLGNPERKYENTRHNIGFDVIDAIAEKYSIAVRERGFRALFGKGAVEGQRVILLKPQTYMNLSGESVREITDYFKIDPEEELIVISDDVSLEVGGIRIRKKGSAGGHNGLKNIIEHLGTEKFQRIRIGVGEKPKEWDLADYVLGRFSREDREKIDESIAEAVKALETMLTEGADAAMNKYNRKKVAAHKPAQE